MLYMLKKFLQSEDTTKVYKTTYDNKGEIAHTKDKLKKKGGKL